jgi:hypothetical protein
MVVGVVASGKWLMNLTGEIPPCPQSPEGNRGKPDYKSTTKGKVMHAEASQRSLQTSKTLAGITADSE